MKIRLKAHSRVKRDVEASADAFQFALGTKGAERLNVALDTISTSL